MVKDVRLLSAHVRSGYMPPLPHPWLAPIHYDVASIFPILAYIMLRGRICHSRSEGVTQQCDLGVEFIQHDGCG